MDLCLGNLFQNFKLLFLLVPALFTPLNLFLSLFDIAIFVCVALDTMSELFAHQVCCPCPLHCLAGNYIFTSGGYVCREEPVCVDYMATFRSYRKVFVFFWRSACMHFYLSIFGSPFRDAGQLHMHFEREILWGSLKNWCLIIVIRINNYFPSFNCKNKGTQGRSRTKL